MKPSRRAVMAGLSVGMASLFTVGCQPTPTPQVTCYVPPPPPTPTLQVTCYTPTSVTATPRPVSPELVDSTPEAGFTPTPSMVGPAWTALRAVWQALDQLALDAADDDLGPRTRDRLVEEHRAALDTLVGGRALAPAVAEALQTAYAQAAFHVWRSYCNMTCYAPMPYPDYTSETRANLTRQAEVLEDMAARSNLDPATVSEARAAIELDIAYLNMATEERQAIIDKIVADAGDGRDYPDLSELGLAISPAHAEAARVLVDLLRAGAE